MSAETGQPERSWPLWEVFVRGKRGLSHVHVGSLHERDAFFDPAADKVYRHPTFYDVPEDVEYL